MATFNIESVVRRFVYTANIRVLSVFSLQSKRKHRRTRPSQNPFEGMKRKIQHTQKKLRLDFDSSSCGMRSDNADALECIVYGDDQNDDDFHLSISSNKDNGCSLSVAIGECSQFKKCSHFNYFFFGECSQFNSPLSQFFFVWLRLRWYALKQIRPNSTHITMVAVTALFGHCSIRCPAVPHFLPTTGKTMSKSTNCSR